MQDANVFCYLTAADSRNKASSAIKLPRNSRWFYEAKGGVEEQPIISSRDPTPAPDALIEEAHDSAHLDATERLAVTFSELRTMCQEGAIRTESVEAGVVFGTDPRSCHVLLGFRGTAGISAKQFAISIDRENRAVLTDMGSAYGTAVETNGQNKGQKRIRDQWVLSGPPGLPDRFSDINIWLGKLALNVCFPNHRKPTVEYMQNLREFTSRWGTLLQKSKQEALVLSSLDLKSHTTTQAPSGAQTPVATPVYYRDKRIGRGACGQVHRVIKMGDGLYYAAKTFTRPSNKRAHDSTGAAWLVDIRREFSIVSENPRVSLRLMRSVGSEGAH